MKIPSVAAALLMALLCACASNPWPSAAPGANAYTDQQKDMFSVCLAPVILVRNVIADKLAGKSEIEAMQDSGGVVNQQIADDIYTDAFTDQWSYMAARFNACAARHQATDTADPGVADGCLQRAMIGQIAILDRTAGHPKGFTYQGLPRPDDATDRGIVDAIYALPDASDYEYPVAIWNACMGIRRDKN